jgi:hypothetical protein
MLKKIGKRKACIFKVQSKFSKVQEDRERILSCTIVADYILMMQKERFNVYSNDINK